MITQKTTPSHEPAGYRSSNLHRSLRHLLAGISRIVAIAACALAPTLTASASNTELYRTSFESMPAGALVQQSDGGVVWSSSTDVRITASYQYTGAQCLHIAGGSDNTVELTLPASLQSVRGITFQSERWTSADPFEFRIQARIGGVWQETSNLDELVFTGDFSSPIVAALPEGPITALRLICTAPAGKGVLIDDLTLLANEPTNVTKPQSVATEPIASKIHDQALFISGTTNTEKVTMVATQTTMTNYAGATITLNGGATLTNFTHTYRIPAIIMASNGDLIAACDARRDGSADLNGAEDIDIAVRRSTDNGATWSEMEIMCDLGEGHPASDPSLVLDQTTGEIFCFYNYMDRNMSREVGRNEYRLWVQSSTDNGKTWSVPRDITDQITLPEWKYSFKFLTSGRGYQTRDGVLLHTLVRVGAGVHIFGSSDHGQTWQLINESPMSPADESKIIELDDGTLMVNSRVNGYGTRHVHTSTDLGQTWDGYRERQLVDPGCNGSIIRYTSVKDGYNRSRLLFSNANSFSGRVNLSLRISYDEGLSWSEGKVIDPGASAYSDLAICQDGTIGILYEPGYSQVRFTSVTLEDLTDNQDTLAQAYLLPGVIWDPKIPTTKAIEVNNASFELPGTSKQLNWESVPGWNSDSIPSDSGVETNQDPTDGSWTGFLQGADPSIWNLTNHTIAAGDEFTLSVDAKITASANSLRLMLYYDDEGSRVTLATRDAALTDSMQNFRVTFEADTVPACIGKQIGIEIDNVTPGYAGFDNVTLRCRSIASTPLTLEERASSDLETRFEGNEIYDGSDYINGWLEQNPTGVTESLTGSDLNRTHTGSSESWIGGTNMTKDGGLTTWASGNSGDWTLETRLMFNEVSNGFALWLGAGSGRIIVEIYDDRTQDSGAGSFSIGHNNQDGAFHTFRITHDSAKAKYHVWRDGQRLTPVVGASYDSTAADNRLIIGDYNGASFGDGTDVTIDYISYDQSGAYLPPGADADSDGISDVWEQRYFGSILGAVASRDEDGDGIPNLDEFDADTDPSQAGSRLAIFSLEQSAPDQLAITVPNTSVNRQYTLQSSAGLGASAVWTNVAGQGPVRGNGGDLIFTGPMDLSSLFFRVEVSKP